MAGKAKQPSAGEFETHFTASGQLVLELGRRLVGRPSVAVAELVKNAYDADATYCKVWREPGAIVIADDGHGMSKEDFQDKWMVIATDAKRKDRFSRKFSRPLSGAKGLGRFSSQFLGHHLRLVTHYKLSGNRWSKISCDFPWKKLGGRSDIAQTTLLAKLEIVSKAPEHMTVLRISDLALKITDKDFKEINTAVSEIAQPLRQFYNGGLLTVPGGVDPGFQFFSDTAADPDALSDDLVTDILERSTGRARIDVSGKTATISATFRNSDIVRELSIPLTNNLLGKMAGDICFLPKRKGTFNKLKIKGPRAYKWVRKMSGVRVYDHGFRVAPYGYGSDDWLNLAVDKASNRRAWRSQFTEVDKPDGNPGDLTREQANPFLKRPNNEQLVGAVFLRSQDLISSDDSKRPVLRQAASREGYLNNEGFQQMRDIVLAAVELLAKGYNDVRIAERAAALAAGKAKILKGIKDAAKSIQTSPSLNAGQKEEVLDALERMRKEYLDYEEHQKENVRFFEAMSQLGMLAGFMSHEMDDMLSKVSALVENAKAHEKTLTKIGASEYLKELKVVHQVVSDQQEFVRMFVDITRGNATPKEYSTQAAIDLIYERFRAFCESRKVKVEYTHIPLEIESPPLPAAAYLGALVNVFTNAIKAVVDVKNTNPVSRIRFSAKTTDTEHVVEIYDTGYGIAPGIEAWIFDPLFTTTDEKNPLGKGMGLGLYLVERLMRQFNGSIQVIPAPEGFTTGFQLRWKLAKE